MSDFHDNHRIRYQLIEAREGKRYQWLFLPGGPGADSKYLYSLAHTLKLPGNIWLIDLPGNGANTRGIPDDYNYDQWFDIFMPMIRKFEDMIIVGHSFGGMFPLLFPELEQCLKGFVILNSAPTLWLEEAASYAKQFNLPDLTQEMQEFTANPTFITFRTALEACLPYYFPQKSLARGRSLLANTPFQFEAAVWWQRKAAEINFTAKWVPQNVPTLIVGAKYDCICPFSLFQNDSRFKRKNIEQLYIEDAGHMSWLENPVAVENGFKRLCERLL